MTTVLLEPDGGTMQAPEGGSLADLCDAHRAPIAFSCRDANCAACVVEVLEGARELSAPGTEERATLHRFGLPPSHRLACRAVLLPGPSILRIRTVTRPPLPAAPDPPR
jgi:ferredoxin